MKNIRKILIFSALVNGKIMDGGLCLIKYATRAECVVDYGELGTFSTEYPWSKIDECDNDGSAFDVLGRRPAVVPSSPEKIGTYFSLLTKDMRKLSDAVNFNLDDDLEKTIGKKFKPNAKTLIFVHGWNSDSGDIALPDKLLSETHPRKMLFNAIKDLDYDVNLIMVDWGAGAKSIRYWIPANNGRVVGSQIEILVSKLIEINFNSVGEFHLAGHSLGAHIVGYAGKKYREKHNGEQLLRITGLDPAGPMYQFEDSEEIRKIRIDRDDAYFVDIIHSNAGDLDVVSFLDIIDQCDTKDAAAEAVACARTCISDGETIIDSIDGDCLRVCLASLEATGNCVVNDLYGDDPINVGIDFPVGDVDFWPNGGSMHSICNTTSYFGDLVCNHAFSVSLFSATLRDNCQQGRRCISYDAYEAGYCSKNDIEQLGWNLENPDPSLLSEPWEARNYYMDTEFESGDFCTLPDPPFAQPPSTVPPLGPDPSPGTDGASSIFSIFSVLLMSLISFM